MNLTRSQLKKQVERAIALGWLVHFQEASLKYTNGYFDTADLMAIASRESDFDPKWLTKAGDGGNGFGLMQADKRSFPEFTKGDGWKDARTGILFGAKVLMQKWHDVESSAGKRLTVKSSKTGKISSFTAKPVAGIAAQQVAIASYNAGRWPLYSYAKGDNPDQYTTGKDYSTDVMQRAAAIRSILSTAKAPSDEPAKTNNKQDSTDATVRSEPSPSIDIHPNITKVIDPPNQVGGDSTVNVDKIENVNVSDPKPQPTGTQTVEKQAASPWTKILALFATITGLGINVGSLIEKRIDDMTGKQLGYMAISLAVVAIALYIWHQAQERANSRTQQLVSIASDPGKNNVEIVEAKGASK